MSLRQRTFSAIRWTTGATVLKTAFQLAQISILARLLAPEDYGLIAIVAVVVSFAGLFRDFGVNSAFIQRREVTSVQRSSLFWLNIVVSASLTLTLIGVSPWLSTFFGDERLIPLIQLSAFTLVLDALGAPYRIAAEKALRFRPVMIIEVVATFTGFAMAVLAGLAGWGVYSLVLGGLTSAVASSGLAWIYLADGWRPSRQPHFSEARSFVKFGSLIMFNNTVNHLNSMIDVFLGGRALAASQLGLYSVPRSITLHVQSIVNPIITRVAFPLIAEVQGNTGQVRAIYLQTLNMTSSTNAPLYVGLAVFAPEIVYILLGPGWEQSADILTILALWGALRSTGNPVGSLLLGMGRADVALKWNLSLLFVAPPVLWVCSAYGPEGLAWGMCIVSVVLFVPGWFVLVRPLCEAGLLEYGVAALKPFGIAVIALAPAQWVAEMFDGAITRIVVAACIAAPLYVALSLLLNRQWARSFLELMGRRTSVD